MTNPERPSSREAQVAASIATTDLEEIMLSASARPATEASRHQKPVESTILKPGEPERIKPQVRGH